MILPRRHADSFRPILVLPHLHPAIVARLLLALLAFPVVAVAQEQPGEPLPIIDDCFGPRTSLIGGYEALIAKVVYPADARAAGVEGRVIVRFLVKADGQPDSLEVVRSPDIRLNEAALRGVAQARFSWSESIPESERQEWITFPVFFRL